MCPGKRANVELAKSTRHGIRLTASQRETRAASRCARSSGHQLAELRKQCGATQAQVAELMGVSQARVSQIEHGKITSMDLVRDYIVALGGTLDVVAHVGDWSVKVA
ncbi:helix-turn-helix domain-containing protein [Nocardia abscessus]|uniref:helix-turn-helix domain-containing protein n=1 Tax=Nocardia abscessus TaxID=120957 RepID=UPI001C3F3489|nr:helix-turn-helix domain-containing protein [Nocardia abscessus]